MKSLHSLSSIPFCHTQLVFLRVRELNPKKKEKKIYKRKERNKSLSPILVSYAFKASDKLSVFLSALSLTVCNQLARTVGVGL